MADITMLPTAGDKPWDVPLNQAITNINVALENTIGIPSGGAEDEVLVKASGTDYDAVWSTITGSGLVPDASTTTAGVVELATNGETTTGTDTVRAVTPAGLAAALATVTVPDASTTTKGIVELATNGEATTGTDTVRAVTPAGVAAAIAAIPSSASGMPPGVGMMVRPAGVSGGTGAIALNAFTLAPAVVGRTVTVDAFVLNASSTNGTTHDVGIYPSNADGTPNFASGPTRSASFTFSSAAMTVTFTALVMSPGLYWLAFRSGGTGPSVAKLSAMSALPYTPAGWAINQVGYADSAITSLPSGVFTPTAATAASSLNFLQLRISAV